jgi:hypothetical protein
MLGACLSSWAWGLEQASQRINVELATVAPRIARRLRARGLGDDEVAAGGIDAWLDEAPVLAELAAASVQGRAALGPRQGTRRRRLGEAVTVEPPSRGACQARANGFSLHAGLVVPAGQRDRLERVRRYPLRPHVAIERLHGAAVAPVGVALL